MFGPLEDERVQFGVIGAASVWIIVFLTSLVSGTLPDVASRATTNQIEMTKESVEALNAGSSAPAAESTLPIAEDARQAAVQLEANQPSATAADVQKTLASIRPSLPAESANDVDASERVGRAAEGRRSQSHGGARAGRLPPRKRMFASGRSTAPPEWQAQLPNKKSQDP